MKIRIKHGKAEITYTNPEVTKVSAKMLLEVMQELWHVCNQPKLNRP